MTIQQQIESFQRFVAELLEASEESVSIDEAYDLWRLENPTEEEQIEVQAIIKKGDAEIAAGNYQTLDDFMDEFRKKNNIPTDA